MALRRPTIEQRERSWYPLLFQYEGTAEELLMRDDWELFREWTRRDGDSERAIADLSRPGALTAALNWYRASWRPEAELSEREFPAVATDTLGVWSTEDHYLVEDQMTGSAEFVVGEWRYERIEGASHWMQLDAPERINALLLEWFGYPHPPIYPFRVDHPLARRPSALRQRARQLVEPDRAGGQGAPVDGALGEQRQRAVDLGGRVVEGAAEVELVVVQRVGGERRV